MAASDGLTYRDHLTRASGAGGKDKGKPSSQMIIYHVIIIALSIEFSTLGAMLIALSREMNCSPFGAAVDEPERIV